MNRQITSVSTKGQFVIPSEMRTALGIKPGTRIAVTQEGSRIVLEPVSEELVDKTRGLFSNSSASDGGKSDGDLHSGCQRDPTLSRR
jgi:AbrB family looped-hinge helix DNA binding protein